MKTGLIKDVLGIMKYKLHTIDKLAVLMFDECSSREQRELGIQICGNGTELETSTDSASYVNIN